MVTVLKTKICQPRILNLAKCPSEMERERLSQTNRVEGVIITRPALKEMLKRVLQAEMKAC